MFAFAYLFIFGISMQQDRLKKTETDKIVKKF